MEPGDETIAIEVVSPSDTLEERGYDPSPSVHLTQNTPSSEVNNQDSLQEPSSAVPVPFSARRMEPNCTLDLNSPVRQGAPQECG